MNDADLDWLKWNAEGGAARFMARALAVLAELDRRGAAIDRVQDLHFATEPGEWICEECAKEWPCPTIRALNGDQS